MQKLIFFLFTNLFIISSAAQRKLIFKDDFNTKLDSKTWITEIVPSPNSSVYTENSTLVLDTKGGVTVWLNKKLTGNIEITYTRKVVTEGKNNDRLSDLNQFWMATDPRNNNLFTRNGVLEKYDSLQLYYVGMGGNSNKTTRFRKYDGTGERKLLQEYTDTAHLLKNNREYHIKITVQHGVSSYWVDDVLYFTYADPAPLTAGYFGFRSTWSRQAISHLRIYQL